MGGWGPDSYSETSQLSSSCLDASYEHARACSTQSPKRILPLSYFILQPERGYKSLQNFFPRENEAIKHDLVEFKVQCLKVFVTMATNLPSCFFTQFLDQLLKFLVNFTLLKYVKSQRSYGFLIIKELIFGFQILDLKDHFSASLIVLYFAENYAPKLVITSGFEMTGCHK